VRPGRPGRAQDSTNLIPKSLKEAIMNVVAGVLADPSVRSKGVTWGR
jgi:hypothetical protein